MFGASAWQSSEAVRIKPHPRPHRATPRMPTPSQVTPTPASLPPPPVTFAQAASNAALELAGSGDYSDVRWFSDWGLWGNHDAPPGARVNWGSPYWWQSALDLRALIRYLEQTHSSNPIYQQIIEQTFRANVRRPGTPVPVNFGNEFMDDTVWWGLAWLEAARYELTIRHDLSDASRFMKVAEWDANYVWTRPRTCGSQGIAWQLRFPPDTITNAEFVALAGELAQVQGQAGPWFDRAAAAKWVREGWRVLWWLRHARLINLRTGHVYDGFGPNCRVSGGSLTYTEGETADALVQLGIATGQPRYLDDAKRFITYALSPVTHMVHRGVLQEPCEARPTRCEGGGRLRDSTVWKALLADAIADWSTATRSTEFDSFLANQARAVIDNAASDGRRLAHCQSPHVCQFTLYWSRPVPPEASPLPVGPGSQEAGLSALTDALSATPGYTG